MQKPGEWQAESRLEREGAHLFCRTISRKQKPVGFVPSLLPSSLIFCGIDRRDFEARCRPSRIRHQRSDTLLLAVRAHLAGRRDQMLLRLAFGAAPRPPLPANVPPLARAYTLVMVDRAQDGEHQALGELSSSSLSFNWGGDTAELEALRLPTGVKAAERLVADPLPLPPALWFEREGPVSDPVEMRRHDGAPLRQPRGPASTHSPRASLPAATMHNPRMNPRSLAYDCARLCRRKPATLAQQAHR